MKPMESPLPLRISRRRDDGVALIIVLAFVVIITGVVLAFFSRALATRQISDASASQAKADLLAQGAADSIIADLQQEILLTSSNTSAVSGSGSFYLPSSPGYMLPQLSGTGGVPSNYAWAPNFLIRSAANQPFFSGSDASIPTSGSTGAIAVSSTTPSLNGRSVSLQRWNSHYLLPLSGTSNDSTPLITSTTYFAAPDWVLVTRNGQSPSTWNSNMATSATNGTTVVGRYAYAVYHEGGLLDANVAGYPTGSDTAASFPVSGTNQVASKPSIAYADLTQLPGGFYQNPQAVDQLVAWRNYASADASGTSLGQLSFSALSGTNYYNYVLNNSSGFLGVSGTTLNDNGTLGATGQSDRMFGSRQELIGFLKNGLGFTGQNLDALNYLATFTRGVNQPSFTPASGRPTIPPAWTSLNGGNSLEGLDNEINPSFLTVRVKTSFTRNDGSTAVPGEPLVKRRFALSRLAWLTYQGPSANRASNSDVSSSVNPGVNNPDYDLWELVHLYGVPVSYLQQGTAANIQNYFGLTWAKDTFTSNARAGSTAPSFHDGEFKWLYNVHCETGQNGSGQSKAGVVASSGTGSITRLEDLPIAQTPREPDFFELLKAAVAVGSKAKGAFNINTVQQDENTPLHPYYYQTQLDVRFDYAIMQLGANIIDQAKPDGYSTRIVFNDGVDLAHEFRGVQNLPYLYRVQSAMLKLRMENSTASTSGSAEVDTPPGTIKDAGVGMLMHMPTIWNPHDENAPIGAPGPAGALPSTVSSPNFRLVADSVLPDDIQTSGSAGYNTWAAAGYDADPTVSSTASTQAQVNGSNFTTGNLGTGSQIVPGAGFPTSFLALNSANSQLVFSVPNTLLFREPTILARPGVPQGSNLAMAPPTEITQYSLIKNSAGSNAWVATSGGMGGFLSDASNPLDIQPATSAPGNGVPYLGICCGLYPINWLGKPQSTGTAGIYRSTNVGVVLNNGPGAFVDYRLQYKDPDPQDPAGDWVTYDEKYVFLDTLFLQSALGTTSGNLSDQADSAQGGDWESFADPRTSRFSAINGRDLESPVQTPAGTSESQEWTDPTNDMEVTDRPDTNSGYAISDNRPFSGIYELGQLYATNGWKISTITNGHFRVGLLEQNNPQAQDNGFRFNGDSSKYSTSGEGPTYYSDPDGVIRGAMGTYATPTGNSTSTPANTTIGLPLATAYIYPSGQDPLNNGVPPSVTGTYQGESRPYFLHRPFRSVAELGYVFSGTPWKNIDFFTPESGDAPILDVFSAYESPSNANSLIAGVVNLNTRQAPVIQALLANASVDEAQTSGTANSTFYPFGTTSSRQSFTAEQWADLLNPNNTPNNNTVLANVANTSMDSVPLTNVSELVGRWVGPTAASGTFSGLSADLTNIYSSVYGTSTIGLTMQNVDRFREAFIRPLAAVGNTRVWNLLIDVVAQTGRYPSGTSAPANFVVDGEQRYWVHVAIDRFTGQVLDKQVEVVKD